MFLKKIFVSTSEASYSESDIFPPHRIPRTPPTPHEQTSTESPTKTEPPITDEYFQQEVKFVDTTDSYIDGSTFHIIGDSVKHEHIELKDTKTKVKVDVLVYYPKEVKKTLPVIIFSPQVYLGKDSYEHVCKVIAKQEYVVIIATHSDFHGHCNWDTLGLGGVMRLVQRKFSKPTKKEKHVSVIRAQELKLIIEQLGEIEKQVKVLKDRIDLDQVGLIGHSYGALACMLLGGTKIEINCGDGDTEIIQFSTDKRIKAIVLLSPPGQYTFGLKEESWENFKTPHMVINGGKDDDILGDVYRLQDAYNLSPFDIRKFNVQIKSGDHYLGGFPGYQITKTHEYNVSVRVMSFALIPSIAFFDLLLKYQKKAAEYLNSDKLSVCSEYNVILTAGQIRSVNRKSIKVPKAIARKSQNFSRVNV